MVEVTHAPSEHLVLLFNIAIDCLLSPHSPLLNGPWLVGAFNDNTAECIADLQPDVQGVENSLLTVIVLDILFG